LCNRSSSFTILRGNADILPDMDEAKIPQEAKAELPPCLEWAFWLVFYQEGEKYPKTIELSKKHPIPCAGSFTDKEEQFDAWLSRKRCAIHLCKNCALSLAVW
jgi:hypothetical protein